MKTHILFIALLSILNTATAQTEQFITPIQGVYMEDYFLVNYVDWSWTDIEDYQCGNKTYDGHQGTDFIIRNFAQMDSGVEVYAADAGVVTFTLDTLFDRNKTPLAGGLGNYVALRHDNGFYTYYGHLKKNSLVVALGDTVTQGQLLGEVGSSGYSGSPHLHFEVWYDSLYNWDPFSGACGNPSSLWLSQLAYIDTFGIIDHGINAFIPTLDTLQERLPDHLLYSAGDEVVNFWVEGFGFRPEDVSNITFFDPDGFLWSSFDFTHSDEEWYYYFWSYMFLPEEPKLGEWTATYFLNGIEKASQHFMVEAADQVHGVTQPLLDYSLEALGEHHFEIHFSEAISVGVTMLVYDLTGNPIMTEHIPGGSKSCRFYFPLGYATGYYILQPLGFTPKRFFVP